MRWRRRRFTKVFCAPSLVMDIDGFKTMKGVLRSRIIQFHKDKRGILRQEWKYQNWTYFQFRFFCDIFVSLNHFHLIWLNVTKTCFESEHFEHYKVVLWNCKDKETMKYARSFINCSRLTNVQIFHITSSRMEKDMNGVCMSIIFMCVWFN